MRTDANKSAMRAIKSLVGAKPFEIEVGTTKVLPSDDDLKQMFVCNELLGGTFNAHVPDNRQLVLYELAVRSKEHRCEQFHVGLFEGTKWSNDTIKGQLVVILQRFTLTATNMRTHSNGVTNQSKGL